MLTFEAKLFNFTQIMLLKLKSAVLYYSWNKKNSFLLSLKLKTVKHKEFHCIKINLFSFFKPYRSRCIN